MSRPVSAPLVVSSRPRAARPLTALSHSSGSSRGLAPANSAGTLPVTYGVTTPRCRSSLGAGRARWFWPSPRNSRSSDTRACHINPGCGHQASQFRVPRLQRAAPRAAAPSASRSRARHIGPMSADRMTSGRSAGPSRLLAGGQAGGGAHHGPAGWTSPRQGDGRATCGAEVLEGVRGYHAAATPLPSRCGAAREVHDPPARRPTLVR